MGNDDEVLVYEDFVLRRSDLDILKGPCYLNDQIIGFYFSYLSSLFNSPDILLVPPSLSFWLTNCDDSASVNDFVEPMKLLTKKIVLFTVNDNDDLYGGDSGTHWSLLVYDRKMNVFVHHDSMGGVNNLHAMKLYETVKPFVGVGSADPPSSKASSSKSSSTARHKKKKHLQPATKSLVSCTDTPATKSTCTAIPGFSECSTPQQMNGYDCGLYVMAIARTICQWHVSNSNKNVTNWYSAVEKHVNASVELKMRTELLELIEDLKLGSEN